MCRSAQDQHSSLHRCPHGFYAKKEIPELVTIKTGQKCAAADWSCRYDKRAVDLTRRIMPSADRLESPQPSRGPCNRFPHARVFTCNCAFGAATACQNSLFNDKAATCLSRTGRGKCSVSASAGFAPPLIFESSRRMLVTAPKNQKQNRRDVSHVGVTLWNITETVMINLRLGGIVFGPCFCRLVLRVTVLPKWCGGEERRKRGQAHTVLG